VKYVVRKETREVLIKVSEGNIFWEMESDVKIVRSEAEYQIRKGPNWLRFGYNGKLLKTRAPQVR
jgi:hypothetical protein